MDPSDPMRVMVPWRAVEQNDRAAIESLFSSQRSPEQLQCLRRSIDMSIIAPPNQQWQRSPEIRRFLRRLRIGAGFFLPLRSPALIAYAVAQLDSVSVIDIDALPAVGIQFNTEAMIAVSHQIALETMSICVLAGMTEEASSNHCWEMEVEIAAKLNLD